MSNKYPGGDDPKGVISAAGDIGRAMIAGGELGYAHLAARDLNRWYSEITKRHGSLFRRIDFGENLSGEEEWSLESGLAIEIPLEGAHCLGVVFAMDSHAHNDQDETDPVRSVPLQFAATLKNETGGLYVPDSYRKAHVLHELRYPSQPSDEIIEWTHVSILFPDEHPPFMIPDPLFEEVYVPVGFLQKYMSLHAKEPESYPIHWLTDEECRAFVDAIRKSPVSPIED